MAHPSAHTAAHFSAHGVAAALLSLVTGAGLPVVGIAGVGALATAASAQTSTDSDDAESRRVKRGLLIEMSKPVTLDVTDQPISDIFSFLADVTGAELEPIYLSDTNPDIGGMDPATEVTIKVKQVAALTVLERVLARAQRAQGLGEEYTWQFTDDGSIEFGPKSELNRHKRLEMYEIADLIYIVPDFDNAPEFDLQSAVQAAGGGGGGSTQSPFNSGGGQDVEIKSLKERADSLIDLLTSTVEPDQWGQLGGDGATIKLYNQSFIVTAPDYIHRQIAGYSFWPARLQQVRKVDGRQQVKIKPSTKP